MKLTIKRRMFPTRTQSLLRGSRYLFFTVGILVFQQLVLDQRLTADESRVAELMIVSAGILAFAFVLSKAVGSDVLHGTGFVVWLRAEPSELATRVPRSRSAARSTYRDRASRSCPAPRARAR